MNAADITGIAASVTRKWAKQRKSEERDTIARARRAEVWSGRIAFTAVARELIDYGYDEVSGSGALPAPQRNIFYAIREMFRERTGREVRWKYFTGKLLRAHLNLPHTENWKVTRDPRGTLIEPHTQKEIGVGTLKIDEYLRDMGSVDPAIPEVDCEFPTCGPNNRYQALLYIEKEGFHPLLKAVKLAERFDIAIMSCKGQSVIAARKLVDEICHREGIPLLVLHDFDKAGFSICQNLSRVSWAAEDANSVAYRFKNEIQVTDLGLRLEDVNKYELKSERCRFIGYFDSDWDLTEEEKSFLSGNRRVELNAFVRSADFVKFIEEKLRRAGIKEKLIPDDDVLFRAYRRARVVCKINAFIEDIEGEADEEEIPQTLRKQIRKALTAERATSWDKALFDIVNATVAEA
jgi:DNA topoisomerase VI subunit A